MTTKKITNTIEKTIKNVSKTSTKLNDFALDSTEKTLNGVLNNANKMQGFTNKAIKNSLNFSATKQDEIFDTLESVKGKVLKGLKKTSKN